MIIYYNIPTCITAVSIINVFAYNSLNKYRVTEACTVRLQTSSFNYIVGKRERRHLSNVQIIILVYTLYA